MLRPAIRMANQRIAYRLPGLQRLLPPVKDEVGAHRRLIRQPTMRRVNPSISNVTYSQSCPVET